MRAAASIRRALCVLALAGIAQAQSNSFDLRAALAAAEAGNLELRAARQQRAQALAGITVARAIPNPTVSFSAARDTPHEGLTYDQPLELGGKRGKRIAVAQEEQKAIEVDITILSRLVRMRTRQAFYRSLASREQTSEAKTALDLATRLRDTVKQRFDAGDVAELEVIAAEVELARTSADYELAAAGQRTADAQLAALLNRPIGDALNPQGRLEDLPPSQALPDVTGLALKSSAEVQRTTQELQVEQRRLELARAQRIPNLDVQLGTDFNAPGDFAVGPRGQIGVTVPLFYRGQGEVAVSTARLELLRLTLAAQQINASAEVAAAYFDFQAKAQQAQRFSQTIVPQTVRLEQMAEDAYRSGKSNLLTVIDAQRKLNEVRKSYLENLLAVQSAFATLEEAVGTSLD